MIRELLSDDEFAWDFFKVGAALSLGVGIVLQCVSVMWPEHKFDIQAYGTGLGLILLAVGGALRLQAPSSVTATSTTTVVKESP